MALHRRSSSQWRPGGPPIPNPLDALRQRRSQHESRHVRPNHLFSSPRYELDSYRQFARNEITTTKYNWLTFLPKNLFEQLHRIANLYFIFIAIINFIPVFQAFSPILGTIPVIVILGVTAVKDGYEDLRRRKMDNNINRTMCHVWDREKQMFRKMQWQYILVGDFVHVANNQPLPADILFIRSSDPQGTAYVETSNLDGETSLKQRVVPRSYINWSQEESPFLPTDFMATVICEKPDKNLHKFGGYIEDEGRKEPLMRENVMLRGSQLRNTTFIEGIVLYAGHETKVMMNNGRAPYKRSALEKLTNRFILYCVGILIVMCVIGGVGAANWFDALTRSSSSVSFLGRTTFLSPYVYGLASVGSFIICYQILIPLSLYITVEIIKLGQVYFMSQDIELYHEEKDQRLLCRSLTIPEELGQVSHVLSDKTGTLTENVMVFRDCCFDSSNYHTEAPAGEPLVSAHPTASPDLLTRVKTSWKMDPRMQEFFEVLAICNTVVVNRKPHTDALEVGYFDEGVFNIGNSAFYDITVDEFRRRIDDLKEQSFGKQPSLRLEFGSPLDSAATSEDGRRQPAGNDTNHNGKVVGIRFSRRDTAEESTSSDDRLQTIGEDKEVCESASSRSGSSKPLRDKRKKKKVRLVSVTAATTITDLSGDEADVDSVEHSIDGLSTSGSEEDEEVEATLLSRMSTVSLKNVWHPIKKLLSPSSLSGSSRSPKKTKGASAPSTPYEAESPDELALVQGACIYGFSLEERGATHCAMRQPDGKLKRFEVLRCLPFDSKRKRQSILIAQQDGVLMYTKGADRAILDRLAGVPPKQLSPNKSGKSHNRAVSITLPEESRKGHRHAVSDTTAIHNSLSASFFPATSTNALQAIQPKVRTLPPGMTGFGHGHGYTNPAFDRDPSTRGEEDVLRDLTEVAHKLSTVHLASPSIEITTSDTDSEALRLAEAETRLYDYASRGLRTLVLAKRFIPWSVYREWEHTYQFVEMDSSDDRDEMLSDTADLLETGLTLIGVTGIEDKLQDGVSETITSLRQAGIQVWLLTGDKLETAVNIARSCGLFAPSLPVVEIADMDDLDAVAGEAGRYNLILAPETVRLMRDGDPLLIHAIERCTSVLCFRMTPAEKSDIVQSVRKYLNGRVLAIGDGANDVPMIQAAHVGIGISGKEGMQAVMASDYALSRFRFLRRLLLLHGHWNYDRLSRAFLYFLYKNANFVFLLFFANIFNGFTGQSPLDPIYMMFYPIIFTALQPLVFGIVDQDLPAKVLLAHPSLYSAGRLSRLYTQWLFWANMADALWQAAVCYFIADQFYWDTEMHLFSLGFVLATQLFIVNNAHLMIECRSFGGPIIFSFVLCTVGHFGYFILTTSIMSPTIQICPGVPVLIAFKYLRTSGFWAVQLLSLVIACLPRFAVTAIINTFMWPYEPIEGLKEYRRKKTGRRDRIID